MEYVFILLLLAGPSLVAFFIACITAAISGRRMYIQSGKRGTSSLFAASLFLVLFYVINLVISKGVGLLFFGSSESGDILGILGMVYGVYIFAFGWILRIVGALIAIIPMYRTRRDSQLVAQVASPPFLLETIPILVLLAAVTLLIPIFSLYQLYQANQKESEIKILVTENEQMYDSTIGPEIAGNLSNVQAAIGTYQNKNGKPPQELNQLVPKYLAKIPSLPVNAALGGTYTYDYEITDPLRNYYSVCVLASTFEAGLTGRVCTDETGRLSRAY
jgi:hypothetical protein